MVTCQRPVLVLPCTLTISTGLGREAARWHLQVARTLYTVWDTGAFDLLDAQTCPQAHVQAVRVVGDLRAAVPDLRCRVEHLHLRLQGFDARLRLMGTLGGPLGASFDVVAHDRQRVVPPTAVLSVA